MTEKRHNVFRKKRAAVQKRRLILFVMILVVAVIAITSVFFFLQSRKNNRLATSVVSKEEATIQDNSDLYQTAHFVDQTNHRRETPDFVGQDEAEEGIVIYKGKKYTYNNHLSNYLFLGVDTDGDIQLERRSISAGQSDAIYLVSYDRKEESLRILSIPRDTMTDIQLYNESGDYIGHTEMQITLQYAYGDGKRKSCELAVDAVSYLLYGMPILGYASINTDSIPLLASVVDGVPLTVPDDSLEKVNPTFKSGAEVVINEENAEQFLRYRDTHQHQQALVRMNRQKVFINAFAKKLKALQAEDPHTVTDVYETMKPHMITNMTNDIFLDLAAARREGSIATVPGENMTTELYDEYHVDEDALYELILDMFYKEVEE